MGLTVNNLRCEYLTNPIGIDVVDPRLSWVLDSNLRNQYQKSYRILVASERKNLDKDLGDLWDSKRVDSNETNQIVYEGKPLESRMECYWKVQVWDSKDNESDWSKVHYWSMGLLQPQDWKAKWIGCKKWTKKRNFRKIIPKFRYKKSPLFRKEFNLNDKKIKKAIAYLTALGEYECYINGVKIGDQFLAPEWTDYNKRVQYQSHDITEHLKKGINTIGAILGDGWYRGRLGPFGIYHDHYGSTLRFLMQIHLEYEEGTTTIIKTDKTWKTFEDGPIRASGHFKGEIYDCNHEQESWTFSGFDDSKWASVRIDDRLRINLVAQMNEPIRVVKEIMPIEVFKTKKGTYIFNLGQNIQGWCKLHLNEKICEPHSTIIVNHGELLTKDKTLYTKNLRTVKAREKYILDEKINRELRPHFTYHGFQYVEIKGLRKDAKPPLSTITGCALSSDVPLTGSFESSDETLNKLWENILWTQRDNMISIPTDCPQRGERMGWMGDNTAYCQTAIFYMNMAAFYSKWVKDIRDAQGEDGSYPDFVPYPRSKLYRRLNFYCAPGWADCGIILPWTLYLNYNDHRLIQEHYPSAKQFIKYIHENNPDLIWTKGIGHNYGDWLNGDTFRIKGYPEEGSAIPDEVFSTIFFAHSTELLSKMANLLGMDEDSQNYSNLAKKIKKKFNEKFVSKQGMIKGDTQGGYALALYFEMIPEEMREPCLENLIKVLKRYDHRISTGFLSTLPMMIELTKGGYVDLAHELLFSRKLPSWFYMIDQGATTMWERWDGYVKGRGVHSAMMNSFNHFSIGSIGEWIYRVILGINLNHHKAGYRTFLIHPMPGEYLKWVRGSYNSINGRIEVNWKKENNSFELKVSIPTNTSAQLFLPAKDLNSIRENGDLIQGSSNIELVSFENGIARLEMKSGTYDFTSELRKKEERD